MSASQVQTARVKNHVFQSGAKILPVHVRALEVVLFSTVRVVGDVDDNGDDEGVMW